jgi:hypothetical protein
MKKLCFAITGIAALLGAASDRDYKEVDREAIHHTFTGDKTIDVDLINGGVTVIGDGGNTIRVEGERVIRAASQEEVARAKKEVALDINEKNGIAQLYENGPYRDSNNRSSENHGFHESSDRHYNVSYDLTVHVPRETAMHLKTVNGGVTARETTGAFDVKSVNGAISMTDIGGAGTAAAVNGANVVSYRENPKADSAFTSVNGRIEVSFQPNLAAEFVLKTVNGGMFTDFESTMLASPTAAATKENGKFVFKTHGESRVRVGTGGPQIRLETVNGSIQIKKATK